MERNDPAVVVDVQALFVDYERALIEGDLDALAKYFDDDAGVVRFGIADVQRGPQELARWRVSQPPLPPERMLDHTTVATYGSDFAVVTTHFSYPARQFIGRQSQTWVRIDGRWRIVHAHVSEIPAGSGPPAPLSG